MGRVSESSSSALLIQNLESPSRRMYNCTLMNKDEVQHKATTNYENDLVARTLRLKYGNKNSILSRPGPTSKLVMTGIRTMKCITCNQIPEQKDKNKPTDEKKNKPRKSPTNSFTYPNNSINATLSLLFKKAW